MSIYSANPFLFYFVSKINDLPIGNSTDIRKFLGEKKILSNHSFTQDQVLIITRSHDLEADLIGMSLLKEGIDYIRLNVDDIPNSVRTRCAISNEIEDNIFFDISGYLLDPSKISVALLRYSELSSIDFGSNNLIYIYSVQQWQNIFISLFNKLDCSWVNTPISISASEDRFRQLSLAKRIGFNIPSSLVTNDPNMATKFYNSHSGHIVIKVLRHHRIDVQNKALSIYTHEVSSSDIQSFDKLIAVPCLMQERIDKQYELRVTVVDDSIFAARLDFPNDSMVDSHSYLSTNVSKKAVTLSPDIQLKCKELVRSLDLQFAALDFIVDPDGRIFFLEANADGDWYWIENETGLPITQSVVSLIMKCRNCE